VEKPGRDGQATDDNILQLMRFPRWITKATNTHSQYVMSIAFPLQQWVQERAAMLPHTYLACLILWPYQLYLWRVDAILRSIYVLQAI
jgi:hypothetical protein